METSSRRIEIRPMNICYTPLAAATNNHHHPMMSSSCHALIEDFEISYVRTIIEDLPLQGSPCSSKPSISETRVVTTTVLDECTGTSVDGDSAEMTDLSENTEMEEEEEDEEEEAAAAAAAVERGPPQELGGNHLRVKLKLSSIHERRDSAARIKKVEDEVIWVDEEDPGKKWHFRGKAYSKVVSGKEHFYCQLCEDDGNAHLSLKRREMERHLRRMDHLPPELFCKEARAVCPCPKNRAFTRVDGRKRHIKISIEHARKDAHSRRALDEVERWNKHMRLLETSRGR